MLNDWKGREDSAAVSVASEKILHYWAEPTEESESRDSSPLSLGAKICDRDGALGSLPRWRSITWEYSISFPQIFHSIYPHVTHKITLPTIRVETVTFL